jgi:hypothetical protein
VDCIVADRLRVICVWEGFMRYPFLWVALTAAGCASAGGGSAGGGGNGSSGSPSDGGASASSASSSGLGATGSSASSGGSAGGSGSSGSGGNAGSSSGGGGDSGGSTGSGSGGTGGSDSGAGSPNVLTNRYDNARTGANTSETVLTTSNVAGLHLLFSDTINGYVYGQPLYVSGLLVGGAPHNVVYVGTSQNMLYAFDADAHGAPLWSKQLETPVATNTVGGGCGDMVANVVGITSTPVISLEESRIYVIARTNGENHLHAFDLATSAEAAGSPVTIGTGTAGYTANLELNRPGLLLLNGVVYSAYGSNCDAGKYHGFIFGHDAHTLAQTVAYNTTPGPTDAQGAIWQSGMGLASDGTTIWVAVANGTGGQSWQVAQLTPAGGGLTVGTHHQETPNGDEDLCAGPVLVGNQVLVGGKSKTFFMLNASDASLATRLSLEGEVHNIATWDSGAGGQMVYAWGDTSPLHQYEIAGGMLVAKGTNAERVPGHPGGMVTVSSNGTSAGSGIVWGLVPLCGGNGAGLCKGALYAWDATDISKPSLWNSTKNAADALGNYAKYSPPTVANGKVYAASWSGALRVYGL